MHESTKTVNCDQHGKQQETFVCEHLLYGEKLGFHIADDELGNPRPDAWCSNCELIRQEFGDWTDEAMKLVKIKLLCGACYDRVRLLNE